MDRWSAAGARRWWASRLWMCGFNYLPSTSVNFLDMWHPDSFDRPTIERELGWAARIGFNAIRVNLQVIVWEQDQDGFFERLDWLMNVAAGLGIGTVPCLFDDCGFGGAEPVFAKQPDPVPGVHNSRAVASPGRARLAGWRDLEPYVREVIARFRDDSRIAFWDLYNEPGNRMLFTGDGLAMDDTGAIDDSIALMEAAFRWARAEGPSQPLTVAAWTTPPAGSNAPPYQTRADRLALALSDIISFHAYWDCEHVGRFIDDLASHDRPLICSEWMARAVNSRIDDQLPLFRERRVGCFQWGLVRGRTQTHLPWPDDVVRAQGGKVGHDLWFHDLLHPDGRPYDPQEIRIISNCL